MTISQSRALETSLAYKHSLHSPHPAPALPSFDPEVKTNPITNLKEIIVKTYNKSWLRPKKFPSQTAHKLEEVSEEYAEDIHRFARMLNTLGKMVKNDADSSMALHLYDRTLL